MTETEQSDASSGVDRSIVELGPDLTIADVELKKIELAHVLSDGFSVKLNGEDIEHIDGAGLQLLAVFFKEAAKANLDISWLEVSASLREAVKVIGLVELLKISVSEVEDDGEGSTWGLF
jgi:anti-anti-sigma regulatory factor